MYRVRDFLSEVIKADGSKLSENKFHKAAKRR
jgi:hypothetical protein